jgi:putative tricarboxylic transport membrane protein
MTAENQASAGTATTDETPVSARADFLSALVWMVLGFTIVVASWNMDRLESQGAKFYTAPGLYPGIIGAVLSLLGGVLACRACRTHGHRLGATTCRMTAPVRAAWLRLGSFLLFGLAYAAGAVGRAGIPFLLATFVFVTGFILLFEWRERRMREQTGRGIAVALAMGAGTAFLVSYVFQEWFLVRLP